MAFFRGLVRYRGAGSANQRFDDKAIVCSELERTRGGGRRVYVGQSNVRDEVGNRSGQGDADLLEGSHGVLVSRHFGHRAVDTWGNYGRGEGSGTGV